MTRVLLAGFVDNVRIALHALRANKMRSLLTVLAVIMGVSTIVAIISVVDGLNTTVFRNVSALGSNTIYVQKHAWVTHDYRRLQSRKDIGFRELHAIEAVATRAEAITPAYFTAQTVKHESRKIEYVSVMGVAETYADVADAVPAVGRFLTAADVERARNVAVIGATVAEELFGKVNPVGQRVRIGSHAFRVVGILSKKGDFFDLNLDVNVVIPYTAFQKSYSGRHRSLAIMVKPDDPMDTSELEDQITAAMRRVRRLGPLEENDFAINKIDVLKDLYVKLTGGLYAAMFAVGAISLVVGGIGIMNIMLVSVTERTREIGTRKAVGAKRRFILYQFLVESVALSCLGGVLGILFGFAVALAVDSFTSVPARVQVWSVGLGLIVSTLTGVFFGLFPAYRASRLDPIEALRYE